MDKLRLRPRSGGCEYGISRRDIHRCHLIGAQRYRRGRPNVIAQTHLPGDLHHAPIANQLGNFDRGHVQRIRQRVANRHAPHESLAVVGGRDGSRCADEFAERRSEEHTSELQSPCNLVCRLLLEKKNIISLSQRVHPAMAMCSSARSWRHLTCTTLASPPPIRGMSSSKSFRRNSRHLLSSTSVWF